MSRGNANELQSPVKKTFEWNGDAGGFKSYNKETKTNDAIPLPFRFLVLDQLSTVKGFNDHKKSGYWANEVRYTKKDILSVYSKGGLQAEGFYSDIIGDLTGAKYCKVVYICYFEGKELVMGKINFVGAALSAWIDFSKETDVEKGAIEVADMKEGKKGKTVYQIPVFKVIEVSEASDQKAIEINNTILQPFLQNYLTSHKEATPAVTENGSTVKNVYKEVDTSHDDIPSGGSEEPTDDLPFRFSPNQFKFNV